MNPEPAQYTIAWSHDKYIILRFMSAIFTHFYIHTECDEGVKIIQRAMGDRALTVTFGVRDRWEVLSRILHQTIHELGESSKDILLTNERFFP